MQKVNAIALGVMLIAGSLAQAADEGSSDKDIKATVTESVETYFKAWNERNPAKRMEHLERAWAADGRYVDPFVDAKDRAAFHAFVQSYAENPAYSGFSLALASDVDVHHNTFRFAWVVRNADGNVTVSGIDVGEFDEAGKITQLFGFFGPLPGTTE